mmetsp:Transcript_3186/g.4978  ORF Transcript_3186/g.4978 Transcript_3186/m.4978 type:complete len:235 (+) Transcript_3186:74-778(+)
MHEDLNNVEGKGHDNAVSTHIVDDMEVSDIGVEVDAEAATQPTMVSAGLLEEQGNEGEQAQQEPQSAMESFKKRLIWFGGKVLDIAEYIGEGVVSVLGIDDSMFQDVLDEMSEEEMAAAVAVNAQREEEYRRAGMLPLPGDNDNNNNGNGDGDLNTSIWDGAQYTSVHGNDDVENGNINYNNNSSTNSIIGASKGLEMKPMQPTPAMLREEVPVQVVAEPTTPTSITTTTTSSR